MIRKFQWGQMKNEKKLAQLSWDKMCMPKDRGRMGFQDLKSFNLALLAKEGWRLQTNSASLFSRVYKAKYFPQCSFVEATMCRNPSYAQRSLMAALGVVQRGMRWQQGMATKSGCGSSTYKMVTLEIPNPNNALVCKLINRANNEWYTDKLSQWFLPEDRDTILSIPLSTYGTSDRLIQAENRSGKFTLKSAYALAFEDQKKTAMVDCSNGTARRKIWKTIWHLNIPYKIKQHGKQVAIIQPQK